MKRKFSAMLLIILFIPLNIVYSSDEKEQNIYCDTINHWCNYGANRLFNENIFRGMQIGEKFYFMPEENITRGEFLLYINAVLKIPEKEIISLPFNDSYSIPYWQLPTVCTMYDMGYIKGNKEKRGLFFNYDEKISRLECAIILNNILKLNNSFTSTKYYDNYLIPKYAVTAVKNVTDYGLMQGYADKSFRPYVKITRAMLSDILCKLKDYTSVDKK